MKNQTIIRISEPDAVDSMAQVIASSIPARLSKIAVVCIGTDRSTGDSLGPITGTYLRQKKLSNFDIYGTLENPLHATTIIPEYIDKIQRNYEFVIAIDASLSSSKEKINSIVLNTGATFPGKGVGKVLPSIGDLSIGGVVGLFMKDHEYNLKILNSVRLNNVLKLSVCTIKAFEKVDHFLSIANVQKKKPKTITFPKLVNSK